MGTASQILKDAILKLESLGLVEANDIYSERNIPSTIRDKSFRVHWMNGTLDFQAPGMNKLVTIQRNMIVLILRATGKTGTVKNQKVTLLDAYDIEETVIKELMLTRLNGSVIEERLISTETQPTVVGEDEWLLTTIVLQVKYRLQV